MHFALCGFCISKRGEEVKRNAKSLAFEESMPGFFVTGSKINKYSASICYLKEIWEPSQNLFILCGGESGTKNQKLGLHRSETELFYLRSCFGFRLFLGALFGFTPYTIHFAPCFKIGTLNFALSFRKNKWFKKALTLMCEESDQRQEEKIPCYRCLAPSIHVI